VVSHIFLQLGPGDYTPLAAVAKFRLDVDIHNLLMDSSRQVVKPAAAKGLTLPEPIFSQYPEKLADPEPEIALGFIVNYERYAVTGVHQSNAGSPAKLGSFALGCGTSIRCLCWNR